MEKNELISSLGATLYVMLSLTGDIDNNTGSSRDSFCLMTWKVFRVAVAVRGHVQTIFGKINVIMTLRGGGGGVACDANFFFVCIAFYYSNILLQLY